MIKPAHSPLGASSAERWMECPGSVSLIQKLELPDTDEPEYRANGTAAHEALAKCLVEKLEPWEVAGETMSNGVVVDTVMMNAITVFLNIANGLRSLNDNRKQVRSPYIEYPMTAEQLHPLYYGTVDFGIVGFEREHADVDGRVTLDVLDFKYGEGIAVEVEENPQVMYYAYGILLLNPDVEWVRMRIVQPRITWHPDGPVRMYECSAEYLRDWAENTLRPAMIRTDVDKGLKPGEHCRFCPAKLICPVLTHLFGAAAAADQREIVQMDDITVDRNWPLIAGVKQYIKALEAETFRRLQIGGDQWQNVKLVKQKANRVWKAEAVDIFKARFGDEAFTTVDLKSPAQMETLGDVAKLLVHEFAHTPDSGLTVALMSDKKPAVKVRPLSEDFKPQGEVT